MRKMILLCGIAGSGKTTYVRELLRVNNGLYRISRDYLRRQLFSPRGWTPTAESVVRAVKRVAIHNILASGRSVVVDEVHNTRSRRAETIAVADDISGVKIECHWLDTSLSVCRRRNRERKEQDQVPDYVVRQQHDEFEPPRPRIEGFKVVKVSAKHRPEKKNREESLV